MKGWEFLGALTIAAMGIGLLVYTSHFGKSQTFEIIVAGLNAAMMTWIFVRGLLSYDPWVRRFTMRWGWIVLVIGGGALWGAIMR